MNYQTQQMLEAMTTIAVVAMGFGIMRPLVFQKEDLSPRLKTNVGQVKLKLAPNFFRKVYDNVYEPYIERSVTIEAMRKDLVPWVVLTNTGYSISFPRVAPPKPALWYHGCEVGNVPDVIKGGLRAPVYISQSPEVATFFGFLRSWGAWCALVVLDPVYVLDVKEDEWYTEKADILMKDQADKRALTFFTNKVANMFYGKLWKSVSVVPAKAVKEVWVEDEDLIETILEESGGLHN